MFNIDTSAQSVNTRACTQCCGDGRQHTDDRLNDELPYFLLLHNNNTFNLQFFIFHTDYTDHTEKLSHTENTEITETIYLSQIARITQINCEL